VRCRPTIEAAIARRHAAPAVVVGKRGTATVSVNERAIASAGGRDRARDKIVFDRTTLGEKLAEWRRQRLAHRLHQWLLRSAAPRPRPSDGGGARGVRPARRRAQQRRIGLALKGKDRPIQNVTSRAEVLAAMEAVDLVGWCSRKTRRWT